VIPLAFDTGAADVGPGHPARSAHLLLELRMGPRRARGTRDPPLSRHDEWRDARAHRARPAGGV